MRPAGLFSYPDALAGASPCGENLIAVVVFDGERQRVGRLGRPGAQQHGPISLAFPASAVVTLRPSGEFHSPRISQEAEPLPTRPSSGWLYIFLDQFRAGSGRLKGR